MTSLNLGCGFNHVPGFDNVDKFVECKPDTLWDLDNGKRWPWKTSSVDAVQFTHSLEHMGQLADEFQYLIQELYRVCKPDAEITIIVPHPRHDDFTNDPTHVRAITPSTFICLSKAINIEWRKKGEANSQLAFAWDVDFEVIDQATLLSPQVESMLEVGAIDKTGLEVMAATSWNICREWHIKLRVVK